MDNEIPSRRIRALWLAFLLQNTVLLIFRSFFSEEISEIHTTSLFINEIVLATLNILSFVAVLNYRKAIIKTINSEIQDEFLAETQENDAETQISQDNVDISSAEIVNKFLNYYEEEQKTKEKLRKNKSCSFSSDEEGFDCDYKLMKNRSQVSILLDFY